MAELNRVWQLTRTDTNMSLLIESEMETRQRLGITCKIKALCVILFLDLSVNLPY